MSAKFRFVTFGAVVTLALASGCRTTGNSSSVQQASAGQSAIPPGAQGLPLPAQDTPVLSLTGTTAKSVYAATKLAVVSTGYGPSKMRNGALTLSCSHNGTPPGAQGFPGTITWNCNANVPIPSGAQGIPAAAFMHISGQAAMSFYQALKAPESYQGGLYQKTFSSTNALFLCFVNASQLPPGAQGIPVSTYGCKVSDNSNGPIGAQGLPVNNNGSSNGGIPSGAQGLPVNHEDSSTGGIPTGAQGLPVNNDGSSNGGIPAGAQGLPGGG